MFLPQPQVAFSPIDFKQAAVARDLLFQSQAEHYNRDKASLLEFSPGQAVRVQNEASGQWELTGVIIEMRPDKLSYLVEMDGRMYVSGRSKLKPVSKFKVGVNEQRGEVEFSEETVNLDHRSSQVQKISIFKFGSNLEREKSASGSSCSLVSGVAT